MYKTDKYFYSFIFIIYLFLCFGLGLTDIEAYKPRPAVSILITKGMTAKDVALLLEDKGIIRDRKSFLRHMISMKMDTSIKTGNYLITPGNHLYVLRQIKTHKSIYTKLTLIPGSGINEIAALLKIDTLSVINELKNNNNFNNEIVEILPDDPASRIAFIIPDTYFTDEAGATPSEFIKMASDLWYERVYKNNSKVYTKEKWLKLATMASIIEKEAKLEGEKTRMAGVFNNRLKLNMKLQSCATVVYAWSMKGKQKKSLTYKDLEIESPFNTYKYAALPPAPISVPDASSWNSVINPEENDFLFFFAQKDGSHIFTKRYTEHIKQQHKKGLK